MSAPFRVSADYIEWAHGPAAEDGQERAKALCAQAVGAHGAPGKGPRYILVSDPVLVAEIADVAELYVGGQDNDLRAARVRSRALLWLREQGVYDVSALLHKGDQS